MRSLLLACFVFSGATGLVLEAVWMRWLTLIFGSTTLAVSTVLATFMGGLGLGSYVAGRWADRLRDPARIYAILEAGIGVLAALVPATVALYPGLNRLLWDAFGERYGLLSFLRFVAAALLLLAPTTLMGATLPVLARAFVRGPADERRVGLRLGTLYAANLFGAVIGAFLAGFVLLPGVGVLATNFVAAGTDLVLAATVLVFLRRRGARADAPTLDDLTAEAEARGQIAGGGTPVAAVPPAVRRAVLASFALSGAAAMTLQVLWTRALAVVIGSSVYSFTLILVAFLSGLGLGSLLGGRVAARTRAPVAALATLHLGIAGAVALSYLWIDDLPFAFAWLASSTAFGVNAILACQLVLAGLALLPATTLMGAVFPLSIAIVARDGAAIGRDVGVAYAINTVGAIAGSFLAGFVVLPVLGLQNGIFAAACAGLWVSAVLRALAPGLPRPRRLAGAVVAAAMIVAFAALPRWNLVGFSIGFFRVALAKDYLARKAARRSWEVPRLLFYEDGAATTVSVEDWGKTISMKNNGKVDASSEADMPTQISVGLLPLLLYPGDTPPRVALIGFGSGVTAGAVTRGRFASLEVVELEPAIYRASRFFEHVNHRPLEHPRVVARVGDGRNFLTQRRDRFDVIISQPSNPWITGVSNLFTREYFAAVKQRLAPGGVFCQWAQLYEMAPWNVKAIYRTLRAEFPYVMVFAAEDLSSDTILIASQEPLPLDLARLDRALAEPATAAEAARAGLARAEDVAAALLLGPDELDAFTAAAPINTDDNALIEFAAPRDLLAYSRYDRYLARMYGASWPYGRLAGVIAGADAPERMATLGAALVAHGRGREARAWIERAEAAGGGETARHARLLLELTATREDRDPEIPLAPDDGLAPPAPPPDAGAAIADRVRREYREIDALVRAGKYASAYKVVEAWPESLWGRLGPDFALLSGFLDYKVGFFEDAIAELAPLAGLPGYAARRPALLYYLGRSYYSNADYRKAAATLELFVRHQSALGRPLLPSAPG